MKAVDKIVEFVKTNKKEIVKRVLIVGGSVLGLAVVAKVAANRYGTNDGSDEVMLENEALEAETEETVQ